MFVDSHCHLDFDALAPDLDAVVARAKASHVDIILNAATTISGFPKVLANTERFPNVYCSVGVHPHDAEKDGEKISTDELVKLTQHPKVVAIGETGLDYFYEHTPREAQQRNFREHIRACIKTGLPLIVHTRDAEEDTIRILREERAGQEAKLTGVLHCFSSKRVMAEYGLEIGFFISFSGMLTFNKSEEIRAIAGEIPMERLLIETDAPYLAPIPLRGKTCEPAYVVHTAARLAEVKRVPLAEIERVTTENFFRLFAKVPRP